MKLLREDLTMEESRILNRGQSILLPYKDDMQMKISSEGADDFDIFL